MNFRNVKSVEELLKKAVSEEKIDRKEKLKVEDIDKKPCEKCKKPVDIHEYHQNSGKCFDCKEDELSHAEKYYNVQ